MQRRERNWSSRGRTHGKGLALDAAEADRSIHPMQPAHERVTRPDRILRIEAVLERTGLRRSTMYRKISEGSFPRQIALSARCSGWRESAIEAWLRDPARYRASDPWCGAGTPGNHVAR